MNHVLTSKLDKYISVSTATFKSEGQYLGNRRCHKNVLSYALANKLSVASIVGGIQIYSEDEIYAHFVVELSDGTLIDPTFGNLTSTEYTSFKIVERFKVSDFNPYQELMKLKRELYAAQSLFTRILTCSLNY